MVIHCLSIATLTGSAADVLFELFKAGLNFLFRAIVLDDLYHGKLQVSAEYRYPLCFSKHPNDSDGTFERLQHDNLIISTDFSAFAVEIDGISLGFLPNLGRTISDRSQALTVLTATASLSRLRNARLSIQYVIAAQPG